MELELGLALPISTHFPSERTAGDYHVKNNGGLALEFKNLMMMNGAEKKKKKKRSFADPFDEEEQDDHSTDQGSKKTLSLLVWNGRRPNGDDEDGEEEGGKEPFDIAFEKDEEDDEIVGWPPIRSWRKKLFGGGGGHGYRIGGVHLHRHHYQRAANINVGGGNRNSIFVKVKMEGVMIGRKIDLMQFDSYQALTNALLNMFAKYKKGDDDDGPYILSYLDKDGDWLLAGDVPWQTFIESVQRMEILKGSNS